MHPIEKSWVLITALDVYPGLLHLLQTSKQIMKKLLLSAALLFTLGAAAQTAPTCKGTTSKGQPCKSKLLTAKSGYCHQHDPNTIRCGANTVSGKPCRMIVSEAGKKCKHHK